MKTLKKIICLVLALMMVFCALPIAASAEVYSGDCSYNKDVDNVTWTLDTETGVLRISGEGHMKHYFPYNPNRDLQLPWGDYTQYIKTLIVEDGVKDVGSSVCIGCKNLTSVILPDDIEYIGYSSFFGCENLEQIDLGNSLKSLEKTAFMCSGLRSIDIPEGITMIPDQAFDGCKNLEKVVIPSSVTYISMGAFANCPKLKDLVIPEGVTEISGWPFMGCVSIKSVTLPSTLRRIAVSVFDHCTGIESLVILEGLETIGETSFCRCRGLKEVTIPCSVTKIEEYAFSECSSITDVYYAGSEEEWNAIVIEKGNDDLLRGKIHFGRVDEKSDEPSENCSCSCHAGGIKTFFWKIANFFNKLFGIKSKQYCSCGAKHF